MLTKRFKDFSKKAKISQAKTEILWLMRTRRGPLAESCCCHLTKNVYTSHLRKKFQLKLVLVWGDDAEHSCNICFRSFKEQSLLKTHMGEIYNQDPPANRHNSSSFHVRRHPTRTRKFSWVFCFCESFFRWIVVSTVWWVCRSLGNFQCTAEANKRKTFSS